MSKKLDIHIRISEEELEQIDRLADLAGLIRSEYVRRTALKERITTINTDKKVIRECRVELSRQGNNLNQIARVLNTYGASPDSVMQIGSLLEKIEKMADMLYEISLKAVEREDDSY